ncbi:AraC family transcriptional regulator [Reyranella sp. CPCC 100927]|uniref:helix-turn-helix transcriptional regulator n=1 Tax=Reyranella sp. CPCC 100927 TaxID=2599616 RepID=UPI0011B4075A|nr:AraC family transcriptional regulator [Reyranella sp. CPCC 100927]TWT12717.1 AraC family transcriptional regulator [Reyranella sp. CPCC 100927]
MARTDPRNITRYWWDRHVPGLSLLRADFTTHEYPPHSHEAFVVAVTETGGSVIKSRGQIEEAHPSTLFVFNPEEPHAGWMGWSHRWRYRSLYLTQSAIDTVAHGLGIDAVPYFTRNMFGDADLIAGFLAMHRAIEDGRDVLREQELLIDSFGCLFQRHGSGGGRIERAPRDQVAMRNAIDLMQARHAETIHLEDLAHVAGLTAFQLIGLFKRTVGLTPHAYLTQIRLSAACRQLRHGVPPAEVAALCGFYDQSALNKHFKRCYGITPLQFARAAFNFRQYPSDVAA